RHSYPTAKQMPRGGPPTMAPALVNLVLLAGPVDRAKHRTMATATRRHLVTMRGRGAGVALGLALAKMTPPSRGAPVTAAQAAKTLRAATTRPSRHLPRPIGTPH